MILKRLRKGNAPQLDQSYGDAQAASLLERLRAGSWTETADALEATRDLSRREFLAHTLVRLSGQPALIDAWLRSCPGSWAATLFAGGHTVHWAWEARSSSEASRVQGEAWQSFFDRLRQADDLLDEAIRADIADPTAWTFKMATGLGVGVLEEEWRRRWSELSERNPTSEEGARLAAAYIGPRWHGNSDRLWRFIGDVLANAAGGDPRHMLVPYGHMEEFVAARSQQQPRVHHSRYFQQPQVKSAIKSAHEQYLARSPASQSPWDAGNREWFACCFYLMGDRARLRAELDAIGDSCRPLPWGFLGSPVVAFRSAREVAGIG